LDRFEVVFNDERAVADAGLVLPATLAEHLGLRELFDTFVDLGEPAGSAGANVGLKAMTLVHSALAGGDCIDDAGALRAGSTSEVLGQAVRAPSTLGTFLRNFTFGHVAQLDKVLGEAIVRAWAAGAGPEAGAPVTIDLDSSICEVYGPKKQGARFGHTKVRGYHPLLATVAGLDDVLGILLRGGNAHTGRGASEFLVKMFNRVRRAGASGPLKLRADSGFYNSLVTAACTNAGVGYSITAKMSKALGEKIAAIAEQDWKPIPYWLEGGADVAETTWRPFSSNNKEKDKHPEVRLIVRRVKPTPGSQLALFSTFSYHAFITNCEGDMVELEADHRRHAVVEDAIRDLKYGVGLNHLPSGRFAANAAWAILNVIAHNLGRWLKRIGLGPDTTPMTTKTLRRRFLDLPGRITTSARRRTLHFPSRWPWENQFLKILTAIRQVEAPATSGST
jgi:hypothetical protein